MSTKKEKDIAIWLNDAYAKKVKAVASLETQVKQTPEYHSKNHIKEHLEETKRHAELFKACLHRYKQSTAAGLSKANKKHSERRKSYPSDMAFVRDIYSSYASKEDSVLSYQAIKAAAEDLGDKETVRVCNKILRDEKKIEDWRLAVGVVAKET